MSDSVACRLCGADLTQTFVDLGMSPPCESYLRADQLDSGETFYPLHVRICDDCLLVQLPAYVAAEDIFSDYAYFSSYSDQLGGARRPVRRRHASSGSASAPTSLRRRGRQQRRLPAAARRRAAASGASASSRPRTSPRWPASKRHPHRERRSSARRPARTVAAEHGQADLVVGNNVFAHVPDIVDFARGLRALVDGRRPGVARVPAPAAADRGPAVRHDLPRALLLPHPDDRRAVLADGRPRRSSTSRSWRPTAGRCGCWSTPIETAGEPSDAGRARCWTTRRPPACTPSRATRASPTSVLHDQDRPASSS